MTPRRSEHEAAALVERNAGLARAATRGFRRPGIEPDDLFQEAHVALYEAALTWDEGNGTPFGGYAWKIIRRSLSHFIRREQSALQLGYRAHTQLPNIRSGLNQLHRLLEREPTVDELADYLGEDPTELATTLCAIHRNGEVQLDKPAHEDGRASNGEYVVPDESVVGKDIDLRATLLDAVSRAGLTDRQKECVTLMYLGGEQRSQNAVAAEMGISRQRVRSLCDAAIGKIRETSDLGDFREAWRTESAIQQPEAQGANGEPK